jgi:hypothetical protein
MSHHVVVTLPDGREAAADYRHYRNPGGAVAYRTDALEDDTAARLLARWPQYLRPNPKRAHELLLARA